MTKMLVTGGAGFIGSKLFDQKPAAFGTYGVERLKVADKVAFGIIRTSVKFFAAPLRFVRLKDRNYGNKD